MFRMYGRKVEILKYQISYTDTESDDQRTDYAASEEEAREIAARVNGTVSALPDGDDAWMDGIEVADVPDTYAEALRILDFGKEAYEKEKQDAADKDSLTWDVLAYAIREGVVQVD